MAIVKQYQCYFGKIKHYVKVKYSSATGQFSIDLPVEAHSVIGKALQAETLKKVQAAYKDAATRFEQASVKTSKIIVVKFDKEITFAEGIAFGFCCGVYEKQEWPGVSEHAHYVEVDNALPDEVQPQTYSDWSLANFVQIPWTQPQEETLSQIAKAFLALVAKMKEFTASTKALGDFLSRQKLLPGWQKGENDDGLEMCTMQEARRSDN